MMNFFTRSTLALISFLSLSSLVQARPASFVDTITYDVQVTPINGGFNPEFAAFEISAMVQACDIGEVAQTQFRRSYLGNGVMTLGAQIEAKARFNEDCNPRFYPVSTVVRGKGNLSENVVIKNVGKSGIHLSLGRLVKESACEENAICTREYRPSVCRVGEELVRGSNPCEARVAAKRFACVNDLEINLEELSCVFEP